MTQLTRLSLPRRVGATVAAALYASLALGATALAVPDEDAAQQAAAEIAVAQDRANEAAAAFAEAESELEVLEDEAVELQQRFDELESEVTALRSDVEAAALELFTSSGASPIAVLTEQQVFNDGQQAQALAAAVQETSADSFDQFESARLALEDAAADLAANQAALEDQRAEYERSREQAEAEVVHLREVEEQRLEDERVRIALAARRRAEEEARRAEAARRAAEAAEAARRQAEAAAAERQQPSALVGTPTAADQPAPPAAFSRIVCPVRGATAYADTWGVPRSGGRTHQGVDLMAPTGTPLVAAVAGSVQFTHNRLGGNAAWLSGGDGARYYYAHLSSFEGSSRGVSQGEVIGYVGMTGNAGAPHLHFEVHPGGGEAVNPYPYVVSAGC